MIYQSSWKSSRIEVGSTVEERIFRIPRLKNLTNKGWYASNEGGLFEKLSKEKDEKFRERIYLTS